MNIISITSNQLRYLAQYNPRQFDAIIQSDTNARQKAIQLGLIKADLLSQIGDFLAQLGNIIVDSSVKAWNYLKENPDLRNTLMDVAGAGIGYGLAKHHYSKSLNDETLTSHSLEDRDMSRMKPATGIPMGAMGGILASKMIRQGLGMIDPNLKENSGMYAANSIDRLITPDVDKASALGIFGTAGAMVGKGLYESAKKPDTMLDENLEGRWGNHLIQMSKKLKEKGIIDANLEVFAFERGLEDFPLIRSIREDYILLTKDASQINLYHENADQIWNRLNNGNRPIRIIALKDLSSKDIKENLLTNIYPNRMKNILIEIHKDIFYFICRYSKLLNRTYSNLPFKPSKFIIIVQPYLSEIDNQYKIKVHQIKSNIQFDSEQEIFTKNFHWTKNQILLSEVHQERVNEGI